MKHAFGCLLVSGWLAIMAIFVLVVTGHADYTVPSSQQPMLNCTYDGHPCQQYDQVYAQEQKAKVGQPVARPGHYTVQGVRDSGDVPDWDWQQAH